MPNFYIISGPNGAGKTTTANALLPEILNCKEYVNADEIARGLSPFNYEQIPITAGKLMLKRIDDLIESGVDFAVETTLASKIFLKIIDGAREKNYDIKLVFFYLNNSELAVMRVKDRVKQGGHNIDKETIFRRYERGLFNLINLYISKVDSWIVIDNSGLIPVTLASGNNIEIDIKNKEIWENILKVKI